MHIIKKILKIFLVFVAILIGIIGLFFGKILFDLWSNGALFLDSKDVIYENWHVRLPEGGKEIYYTDSGANFHGDGQRYSVYKYDNEETISNAFEWKNKKDKNIEEEIKEVLQYLKEENVKIPEKYKIDFNKKYKYIAKAMGVENVENMSVEEYRKAAIDAVKKLSSDIGIPSNLKDIVKVEDIDFLAQSAYDDACRPGNPKETSVEDIANLYKSLL